jgi:hypothetical protein
VSFKFRTNIDTNKIESFYLFIVISDISEMRKIVFLHIGTVEFIWYMPTLDYYMTISDTEIHQIPASLPVAPSPAAPSKLLDSLCEEVHYI